MTIFQLKFGAAAALLWFAASQAQPAPATGVSFYVAPSGNDLNPGTEQRPLATLSGAQARVRAVRKMGMPEGGVTVWVHGGLYTLDRGLTLEAADSGEPDRPVVWRSVAGEHARVFGGVRLSAADFAPVTDPALLTRMAPEARGHVVALRLGGAIAGPKRYADLFKGNGGMPLLLFNDSALPLSRWPHAGYTTMASVVDSGITPPHGGVFHYRPEAAEHAARWVTAAGEGQLWLTGFWRVPFETNSIRVGAIDLKEGTITFAAPSPGGIGSKYGAMVNGTRPGDGKEQYYAFNLLEEIDMPGEWSYDFARQTLFLWPPAGDWRQGELLLAKLAQPVVSLNGASHVVLRQLEIEGGLGQAVAIAGGSDDLVAGCTIRNTGGGGIDVEGGLSHRIESNDLKNIGSYGIRLVAGDRATLTPAGHIADNNHISNYGRQERITQAIYLGGVGNRATHNLIHDGTYNGIEYQGNDQYMAYNEIHHIGLDAGDLGAFYTNGDWAAQGNVIEYNLVHHALNANGSYIDDGSSGRTARNNVFYKLGSGIFLGGGHNNVITNNLIVDCRTGIHVDDRGVARHYDATAHHLTQMLKTIDPNRPPWSTHYPNFLAGILENPTEPSGNIFRSNVIVRAARPYQLSSPSILNQQENPDLHVDAQFADESKLDFSLRPTSPIFTLLPGFQTIPFSQIGLRLDEYRASLPTAEETGRDTDRVQGMPFDSTTDVKASDALGGQKH